MREPRWVPAFTDHHATCRTPRSGLMIYSPTGRPLTVMEWTRTFEEGYALMGPSGRHLGDDSFWFGTVRVSTVWLGVDYSFDGGDPMTFASIDRKNVGVG